jgi:2-(3-amino-3-carboxypropyl)histidine synthase
MEEKNIQGIKTIFVPAEIKNIDISKVLKKLKIKEKKIGLISTIQYMKYLDEAKEFLEKKGYKVQIAGQMVGCNVSKAIKIKNKVDAFVFIGSGEFHPLELVENTKSKNIYFVNPYTEKVEKLDNKLIERLEKKKKGRLAKYHMAKKIGIIVTTKPGQQALGVALNFAKKCKKEASVFIGDEIDINRLEDFNDIEMWVTTCCPRLESKNIIPLKEILEN